MAVFPEAETERVECRTLPSGPEEETAKVVLSVAKVGREGCIQVGDVKQDPQ